MKQSCWSIHLENRWKITFKDVNGNRHTTQENETKLNGRREKCAKMIYDASGKCFFLGHTTILNITYYCKKKISYHERRCVCVCVCMCLDAFKIEDREHSSLNRIQFKDSYNLQPLSTCHVVIYESWFRFSNSPMEKERQNKYFTTCKAFAMKRPKSIAKM